MQVAPQALERRAVEQGSEERRAENWTARHEKVARKSGSTLLVNPKRFGTAGEPQTRDQSANFKELPNRVFDGENSRLRGQKVIQDGSLALRFVIALV